MQIQLGCYIINIKDRIANKIYINIIDVYVQLENGPFLQTKDTWESFIANREIKLEDNAGELYFETQDMDVFFKLLELV